MWIRRSTVFLGALILYLICLDRGASLWDCPEYITVAWRLEVGHPPGNPTWQLIANVLSHLGGSPAHAAVIINAMSAVAMALASLFLSGIIFIFLRASFFRDSSRSSLFWANVCAACGALCYAWCDSAIFSAIEAEVYALSAMFTSLMLLLALKWAVKRRDGDIAASRRIIIFTAYLAGLGVGVHELNFLILPAMALVYWFGSRKFPLGASLKNIRILGLRTDGFPTAAWSLVLFLIGVSTYFIIPLRASARPPLNTGNPYNWERFASYYKRDQYGSKPLLYGRTPFSTPLLREEIDTATGEYSYDNYYLLETPDGKKEYVYPEELNMWFPRMTSPHPDDIEFYGAWTGMVPENMIEVMAAQAVDSAGVQTGKMNPETGEREMKKAYRPTYAQQLAYLMKYQIGFMYARYLMWNFSGRQNNLNARGGVTQGNFITGYPPIDDAMLGPQAELPANLKESNPGYNRYFMIPLLIGLLGIVGLCVSGRSGRRVCAINALFFLFTGLLIVVYLNQDPGQPRERDYSFLGSYMAFAVWIGCGMGWMASSLLKLSFKSKATKRFVNVLAFLICAAVPAQMLSQTYDDHDRRHSRGAEDVARDVLSSVEPGAIVLANGDNVIFPLWYAQEVLGMRRDVSVVAIPYLTADWYREQLVIPGEGAPGVKTSPKIPSGRGSKSDRAVRDLIDLNSPERAVYRAERMSAAVRVDTVAP